MTLETTAVYAAALALIAMLLSINVIVYRARLEVDLGDGGQMPMLTAIRRHGNFVEYVPLALILLAFNEIAGLPAVWLHLAGTVLIVARLIHPFGLGETGSFPARVAGALASIIVIAGLALALLIQSL